MISIDRIAGTSIHKYLFGTVCVDEATSFPGSLFFFPSPSARKRETRASEREVESLGTTLPRTQKTIKKREPVSSTSRRGARAA